MCLALDRSLARARAWSHPWHSGRTRPAGHSAPCLLSGCPGLLPGLAAARRSDRPARSISWPAGSHQVLAWLDGARADVHDRLSVGLFWVGSLRCSGMNAAGMASVPKHALRCRRGVQESVSRQAGEASTISSQHPALPHMPNMPLLPAPPGRVVPAGQPVSRQCACPGYAGPARPGLLTCTASEAAGQPPQQLPWPAKLLLPPSGAGRL